ncbi:MAG: hypothetical protein AB8F78_19455 [Saprospiraceae bacterium]
MNYSPVQLLTTLAIFFLIFTNSAYSQQEHFATSEDFKQFDSLALAVSSQTSYRLDSQIVNVESPNGGVYLRQLLLTKRSMSLLGKLVS